MAPHSSTLAWKIPWTEEPGRLQSMGSQGVGHNWATPLSLFTFMHWRRKWQPTPVFLPGESQGREPGGLPSMGSQSRTRLKRLSSSSSSSGSSKGYVQQVSFRAASSSVLSFYPNIKLVLWLLWMYHFSGIFSLIFVKVSYLVHSLWTFLLSVVLLLTSWLEKWLLHPVLN